MGQNGNSYTFELKTVRSKISAKF